MHITAIHRKFDGYGKLPIRTQSCNMREYSLIIIQNTKSPVPRQHGDPISLWCRLHCRGVIPRKIKEPLDFTTEHLLQLELEMNGEHTKFFVPWTLYPLYVFCGLQGSIALLIAINYSIGMGNEQLYEWAELLGVAVAIHIFGFEICKVIILSICAAMFRKNWLIFT